MRELRHGLREFCMFGVVIWANQIREFSVANHNLKVSEQSFEIQATFCCTVSF